MLINCVARVRGDEKSAGGAVDLEERKIVKKKGEGKKEGRGKENRERSKKCLSF